MKREFSSCDKAEFTEDDKVKKAQVSHSRKDYLVLFFAITLLWTWMCGFIPIIFGITGTSLGTFIFYFGGGAPSVVGLFIVFFTYSKAARKDYFHRCLSFRYMGWKWLLYTTLFFVSIGIIGIIIGTKLIGMQMPQMDWINMAIKNPLFIPLILILSLVSGPLNEEFGWRGFALDKLLVRFGFLKASLILGFIWGIWHLAWYFAPGQAQYDLLQKSLFDALMYIPAVMLLSCVISFVYLNTNRSILAGAYVHMAGNLFNSQLLSPYSEGMGMTIRYVKIVFCLAVVIYAVGSKKFARVVEYQISEIKQNMVSKYEN